MYRQFPSIARRFGTHGLERSSRGLGSSQLHRLAASNSLSSWARARSPMNSVRRNISNSSGPFQPLRPPPPSSLGAPQKARQFTRSRKWGRRLLIFSVVGGVIYIIDRYRYAGGILRSMRTFGTGLWVAVDYKLNFRPQPLFGGSIEDLHRRSADTLSTLLYRNGGLYLKIGQAIAMQSAILPPEFQRMFSRMFDDAPQDNWKEVQKVIRKDFGGRGVEEIFGVTFDGDHGVVSFEGKVMGLMEREARASASVAQVHWARLPNGKEVAIKIQKPEIEKQIGWDIWAWTSVMRIYTWWFDLPLYSIVPFVTERLMLETDFENEAKNGETMRQLVENEPTLRGRVYIPKNYPELSSRRVLTTEWVEGVRLWDKETMTGRWMGGFGNASPGVHGSQLSELDVGTALHELHTHGEKAKLKPERTEWRGPRRKGGLGLSTTEVMTTMIDLFSAQIFKWGVVHCDPHPGNIFIRRLPSGKPELVLIDHGLYVYMKPKFRREYSLFWKSLMTFDNERIKSITREWGIGAADLFASATLMRPYEGGQGSEDFIKGSMEKRTASERTYEMQKRMKQGIKDFLAEEENFPKELVFIGRNMRIVQANNQFMGSPVNRIKRMGNWASRSLFEDIERPWRQRLDMACRHLLFKSVMFLSDIMFYFFRIRQILGLGGGMEDELENQMKEMAKDFGIDLQNEVFEGLGYRDARPALTTWYPPTYEFHWVPTNPTSTKISQKVTYSMPLGIQQVSYPRSALKWYIGDFADIERGGGYEHTGGQQRCWNVAASDPMGGTFPRAADTAKHNDGNGVSSAPQRKPHKSITYKSGSVRSAPEAIFMRGEAGRDLPGCNSHGSSSKSNRIHRGQLLAEEQQVVRC
ncbi:putative ABC1 family protein [Zalerion maritima]|uniref:ABC1 family protein n=1 Tax=Zalerion maritima TaxID=339359 RepID=A0AAD5WVQ5_9PEZI|nr:putative ABC1 family protein [Zalerion maritima]